MSQEIQEISTPAVTEPDVKYEKEYLPKVHKFGTITMLLVLVLSYVPALYLRTSRYRPA